MSKLKITVDVVPGGSVANACSELQSFADRLQINVIASLNGVRCMAVPGGDAALLYQRQAATRHSRGGMMFASSVREAQHG